MSWCGSSNVGRSTSSSVGEFGSSSQHVMLTQYSTKKHARALRLDRSLVPGLARFEDPDDPERNYKWHSGFQPWTARIAMLVCFFILTVASSAALWKKFNWVPFLSSFLAVSNNLSTSLKPSLTLFYSPSYSSFFGSD